MHTRLEDAHDRVSGTFLRMESSSGVEEALGMVAIARYAPASCWTRRALAWRRNMGVGNLAVGAGAGYQD